MGKGGKASSAFSPALHFHSEANRSGWWEGVCFSRFSLTLTFEVSTLIVSWLTKWWIYFWKMFIDIEGKVLVLYFIPSNAVLFKHLTIIFLLFGWSEISYSMFTLGFIYSLQSSVVNLCWYFDSGTSKSLPNYYSLIFFLRILSWFLLLVLLGTFHCYVERQMFYQKISWKRRCLALHSKVPTMYFEHIYCICSILVSFFLFHRISLVMSLCKGFYAYC